MAERNPITAYWLQYYTDEFCTLCGNSGVIDTRGVRTAAGVSVGRLNYCICPNGQGMREQDVNLAEYVMMHTVVLVISPSDLVTCSCMGQSGRVPHDPHCPAHPEYDLGKGPPTCT